MALTPGTRLGPYEVVSAIGAGGMGEVYRATEYYIAPDGRFLINVTPRRGILLLDADLHADQEASLLADGSTQANLWGINLYPDVVGDDWLEFDSMINLRPSFGNRSRGVDDAATRAAIAAFMARVVRR